MSRNTLSFPSGLLWLPRAATFFLEMPVSQRDSRTSRNITTMRCLGLNTGILITCRHGTFLQSTVDISLLKLQFQTKMPLEIYTSISLAQVHYSPLREGWRPRESHAQTLKRRIISLPFSSLWNLLECSDTLL